jgi:hypothetical protein
LDRALLADFLRARRIVERLAQLASLLAILSTLLDLTAASPLS